MAGEGEAPAFDQAGKSRRDQTNSDGFAALAILSLTIAFIVAIVVFAVA